jgi:hypothetical protein
LPIRATCRKIDFIGKLHHLKLLRHSTSSNEARRPREVLLKALIERYIAEGQPVGRARCRAPRGLELSPATIRNVMSDLEELGLVASPIPPPAAFRLRAATACSSTPC